MRLAEDKCRWREVVDVVLFRPDPLTIVIGGVLRQSVLNTIKRVGCIAVGNTVSNQSGILRKPPKMKHAAWPKHVGCCVKSHGRNRRWTVCSF